MVERLEMTHAQLQARSHRLDRQIWTLEGVYMSLTGLELSRQDYGLGIDRLEDERGAR